MINTDCRGPNINNRDKLVRPTQTGVGVSDTCGSKHPIFYNYSSPTKLAHINHKNQILFGEKIGKR